MCSSVYVRSVWCLWISKWQDLCKCLAMWYKHGRLKKGKRKANWMRKIKYKQGLEFKMLGLFIDSGGNKYIKIVIYWLILRVDSLLLEFREKNNKNIHVLLFSQNLSLTVDVYLRWKWWCMTYVLSHCRFKIRSMVLSSGKENFTNQCHK